MTPDDHDYGYSDERKGQYNPNDRRPDDPAWVAPFAISILVVIGALVAGGIYLAYHYLTSK